MPAARFAAIAAVCAAALSLALYGCGETDNAPDAAADGATVVRIGSVAPLTGPQAHLGQDNDNGARLAVDELNATGVEIGGRRVRIEIVSEDDQADPRTATVVAQKLADEGVSAVVGHLNSGASIPASKIYHDARIVQVSPSATAVAYTAQGFDTALRVMTNDLQQGHVLGEYAVRGLGAKQVAIVDDRTAYGQGLADEVEKAVKGAGGTVIAREFTTDKSTDFTAILTAIKGHGADLVFFGGMDGQAAPMVRQMRALGMTAAYLSGDGVQSAEFVRLAGADAEGVTASSPGLPLDAMPGGAAFRAKFQAKYGVIQNYAPYAYDAVHALVAAMRTAGSAETDRFLPILRGITHQGVTGTIAFDDKGDLRRGAITMYRVKNGAWEVLETVARD